MQYPYDLVIFDLAGTTVVDEGNIVSAMLCRALKEEAGAVLPLAAATALMGIPKPQAIRRLLVQAGIEPVREMVHRTHERFRQGMLNHYRHGDAVAEIAGTTLTFRQLRESGVRIGIDTGFSRDITDAILERLGWQEAGLIDVSVASDEVPAGRPAPFMVFRAMEKLGVTDVRRVVKVGDTPSDLGEGMNAGCGRVVGVTAGSHTREQLLKYPHTDLITDVSELPVKLLRGPRHRLQLHTPGPANTSATVRAAMTRDVGAWDRELIDVAADIRRRVLAVAKLDARVWDCVLMQGSGTFGVEAAIGSAVPRRNTMGKPGTILVATNGAYGDRMARIAETLEIPCIVLRGEEELPIAPAEVVRVLTENPDVTTVAVVHCETTTGLLNDITAIGQAIRDLRPDVEYVVDAMSSFGAYDLDWHAAEVDWLVSSSNKCLQGTPGVACILARRARLEASAGRARSLSLDVFEQWRGFETHGRFRFTPPTHVLLALQQALTELEAEGGVTARFARYERMRRRLVDGMTQRGYRTLIKPEHRSCIISTFEYPEDGRFSYLEVYTALARRGFVIYPGKLTRAETFRIGHIGDLDEEAIDELLLAFDEVQQELGFVVGPADAVRPVPAMV